MSYLVLARKYRPQTFEQVVSQKHVTRTLGNAISSGKVAHALLFSGPRGTGKTTVARILAKAMNCKSGPIPVPCNECSLCIEISSGNAADVFEIDGASNNGVEQIRELRENIRYMPVHSLYKIYIIDEVHMLSIAAFNALLKTLEEPPPHVMFVFATTEPDKIPVTILSRCQRHDFRRIESKSIAKQMKLICSKENISITEESLWLIAREADGSMRDALSLLDQVIICSEGPITGERILDILGLVDRKIIFDISNAVLSGNIAEIIDILNKIYNRGYDMKKLHANLMEHFRNLFIVKIGKKVSELVDFPDLEINLMIEQTKEISAAYINQILLLLAEESELLRFDSQPKLALEMMFIKMFQIKPVLPIDLLIEKLDSMKQEISETGVKSAPVVNADPACPEIRCDTQKDEKNVQTVSKKSVGPLETENQPDSSALDKGENLDLTWKKITGIISKKYPSLASNLARSRLINLAEKRMDIEVNGSDFNLKMIKRNKNISILKNICSQFFGNDFDIVINAKIKSGFDNQQKKTEENKIKQKALNHPLVADSIEIFNGTVVSVKILQEEIK